MFQEWGEKVSQFFMFFPCICDYSNINYKRSFVSVCVCGVFMLPCLSFWPPTPMLVRPTTLCQWINEWMDSVTSAYKAVMFSYNVFLNVSVTATSNVCLSVSGTHVLLILIIMMSLIIMYFFFDYVLVYFSHVSINMSMNRLAMDVMTIKIMWKYKDIYLMEEMNEYIYV